MHDGLCLAAAKVSAPSGVRKLFCFFVFLSDQNADPNLGQFTTRYLQRTKEQHVFMTDLIYTPSHVFP